MENEYNGVVYLKNSGVSQASGAVLWTGKHIITAAHFVDDFLDESSDTGQIEIGFNTSLNLPAVQAASVFIHPGWQNDPANFNHDIAIIELTSEVDSQINRYQLYRDFNETDYVFNRTGYSASIDPNTGIQLSSTKGFHSGLNQYDTTTDQINHLFGTNILKNYQLSYDFDDGSSLHDAYGSVLGINDLGTGIDEVFSNPGDSGGPAFINNKIAGIASYIFRYQSATINPDITSQLDSSYGELASDTRVSKYSNWIDSIVLADEFIQAIPTKSEEVDLNPVETDTKNSINYFLLQIGSALIVDSGVSYETIDGTATAGQDYVYTSGQAIIPAGDTSVAIAVEIIADLIIEDNETFGVRVFQPFGGIFPEGMTELRAEHTIIDNDHLTPIANTAVDIIA
jgi:hypothetical protein